MNWGERINVGLRSGGVQCSLMAVLRGAKAQGVNIDALPSQMCRMPAGFAVCCDLFTAVDSWDVDSSDVLGSRYSKAVH